MNTMLKEVLEKEFARLKEPTDFDSFIYHWEELSNKFAIIESGDDPQALNIPAAYKKQTSAKGLYQFTDASFITGKTRLRRYVRLPDTPSIFLLNRAEQTALMIANLCQQVGTDKYIVPMVMGIDTIANMRELYAKYHHTNPDKRTIRVMNKVFK